MLVEVRPGIVLRLHIHRLIVVQEVKRKRKKAVSALIFQVQGRSLSKRGEKRIARKRTRRLVYKSFRQFKRFWSFIYVESENEVRLDVGHIPQDHVDVIGDLADFIDPLQFAGLRFVAEV